MGRTPQVRTAGQRPLIALVAGVCLVVGVSIQARDLAQRVGSEPEQLEDADVFGDGSQPVSGDTVALAVGPPTEASVERYIEDRQEELAGAPEELSAAVVSFTELQLVGDAVSLVGGLGVERVLYRLPLPEALPDAVRADGDAVAAFEARLGEMRVELEAERDTIRQEMSTVTDETFVADYELRLAEIAAALDATSGSRPVVHGLVVTGSLEQLRQLQAQGAVRLVDPVPVDADLGRSQFYALLPSDTEVVSAGR